MMKKRILPALLATAMLLSGCAVVNNTPVRNDRAETASSAPEETIPAGTIPQDGNPKDITCKGTYTGEGSASDAVATVGEETLTVSQLRCWYWAEAAQYRAEHPDDGPDFSRPLDTQSCPVDSSVNSWQQYFLKRALNTWHAAQALVYLSEDTELVFEEAYQPNLENYAKYLQDIPATDVLYGYSDRYRMNSMHRSYLDALPEKLGQLAGEKGLGSAVQMAAAMGSDEKSLQSLAELYNQGYMYLTYRSYEIAPDEDAVKACFSDNKDLLAASGITRDSGDYVDARVCLMIPDGTLLPKAWGEPDMGPEVKIAADGKVTCTEDQWEACRLQAEKLVSSWMKADKGTEAAFANMAHNNSKDTGTGQNGGSLRRITKGQLIPELDSWLFDAQRQSGDAELISTDYGWYIVYYANSTPIWYAEAEDLYCSEQEAQLIREAMESYPMEVTYSRISLTEGEPALELGEILYPDVAHERYPEIPLYLQHDYPQTKFGSVPIRGYGCGITSMAMLATYMTDEELTPPIMCERFGTYGSTGGTDGMIFQKEPQGMGFFLLRRSFEPSDVLNALNEGYTAICVQRPGYWTRAGHYIVLEKVNEDGTIQVRDSNIFNYNNSGRPAAAGHVKDGHKWFDITSACTGYWIFDKKITRIPACSRCGDIDETNCHILAEDYLCEKCRPAVTRRQTYLAID